MRRLIRWALVLGVIAAAVGWFLTAPKRLNADDLASYPSGEMARGEYVFWAGGCASCHAAPKSSGDAKKVLAGGVAFKTPFGIFYAPNISPDREQGLGNWSLADFANAMKKGVSPDGAHYYPAFPFTSYAGMTPQDVADLWAFMKQLPVSTAKVPDHDLPFPFNIRRGLGLWKLLYASDAPVLDVDAGNAQLLRGQYLVEVLAHCGACHTPRNLIGGPDNGRWLAGGISPEGGEKIPNITPHATGIGGWSASEIADSLKTGFTPEFDSFGSSMADVVENMARLTDEDRAAIAAYLKAVPPVENRP